MAGLSYMPLVRQRRGVLVEAGLGQRLAVERQKYPQIDGLRAVIAELQVEHGAPAVDGVQWPGRGDLDGAARGADHRFDMRILAQQREVAAGEIDHESPREIAVLLANDTAEAVARGVHLRQR